MSERDIIYTPFSELLSNVVDNRGRTCPTSQTGLPLIATNCIRNENLYPTYETLRYVSDETYKTWFRGHPLPGDLIFVTKGTPGRVCLVPPTVDFCIAQDMVAIRANPKKVNPRYLFAALRSAEVQNAIENLHVGSLIPHFKKGDFDKLQIPVPRMEVQEYIGTLYLTLSAKIDLLHRQNKTLEGIAEALYRHFFVDNRLVGWEACIIGDLAFHEKIGVLPNRKPDLLFHHYSIPAFDGKCMPLLELGISIQSNKYKVTTDTILFSKLNPHKDKRIWLIRGSVPENSVCSTEFQVLRPRAEMCLFFLYGFLSHSDNYEEIAAGVGGTSGSHQRIDPEVIFKTRCFLPDDKALIAYNEMVGPVFDKIRVNLNSMITLSRLRDTLLPKLMSGEVRVRL